MRDAPSTTGLLVSVITPSYNQGDFIQETLESVWRQEHRPIEHIVIDGASTDNTLVVLQRWAEIHNDAKYGLKWVSEPDRGHGDAINKGFSRVAGEVVGWLNSDDVYFDRHAVKVAVAALQRHPEVDVVFGEVALISEHSGLQMIWCFPPFSYERALRNYIIPQPTVFFRRCVTDRHRLDSDLLVGTDQSYWLIIGRDHKFRKINRIQAGDRDHPLRQTHVKDALWRKVGEDLRTAHGGRVDTSVWNRCSDLAWKILMRVNGMRYALMLLTTDRIHSGDLAYSGWVDSPIKLIARQLTMRLGSRSQLGPRPSSVKPSTLSSR